MLGMNPPNMLESCQIDCVVAGSVELARLPNILQQVIERLPRGPLDFTNVDDTGITCECKPISTQQILTIGDGIGTDRIPERSTRRPVPGSPEKD